MACRICNPSVYANVNLSHKKKTPFCTFDTCSNPLVIYSYALARHIEKSAQTINKLAMRDSWTAKDLIYVTDYTNTKLAFIDKDNKPLIIFDKEDLRKRRF